MIKPFDDDERSRGSSLDDEFLNYLSGDIPPPIPPPLPPPAASMAPASAASETNQSLVELMLMSTMAKMADAGVPPAERAWRQKTLAKKMADMPAGSTPANLAGVLARALLEMAEADAEALDPWDSAAAAAAAAHADDLHPPPSAPPIELLIKDELFDVVKALLPGAGVVHSAQCAKPLCIVLYHNVRHQKHYFWLYCRRSGKLIRYSGLQPKQG